MILWMDFETRSRCDIKTRGIYNYAQDASTEIICMAWVIDDGEIQLWIPGEQFPVEVQDHFAAGRQIRARNAAFERLICWYVLCPDLGLPEPPLESFYCTAAQARANCLPGSLEDNGKAINSKQRKDHRGAELIRKLSIPRADGAFNLDPVLLGEMYSYCVQDVRTDRILSQTMRPLSDQELDDYHTNERINDRGVGVDVALCRAAQLYAADELEEVQDIFTNITGLPSVRSPRMKEWVLERVGPAARELMARYKDGEKKYSIDKSARTNLLALAEENHEEVSEDVAEVLRCADDVWASSTAKFGRLEKLSDVEDGRVRGAFVFSGGSATGRFSSYGAQVHNFTRNCAEAPEDVRRAMVRRHRIVPEFGRRTSDVLRGMLRPSLIPKPGHVFVVADWSAIEGRVTPWAADSEDGEAKLDVFRNKLDPYIVNAAATYRVPYDKVTKQQRQVGKVQELALGFAGGHGAFEAMGRGYGLVVSEMEAKLMVQGWRSANPWAMPYWTALEAGYTAAMRAGMKRGRKDAEHTQVGRVTYFYDTVHIWYQLPSGRVLCYPFAKFAGDDIEYLKAAWKPAAGAEQWPRARLWRGLACENITQAIANDLLRHALRECEKAGLPVVLHVHDEVVLEVPENQADVAGRELERIMTTPPAWAEGLPLAVEWSIMTRYGK